MPESQGPGQEPHAPTTPPPPVMPPEPEPGREALPPQQKPLETEPRKGPSRDEKTWAMACHLAAITGYFTFFGFFLGPLVVWLLKKDEYPLVDDQGKESLNFQLSLLLYYIASALLVFVIVGIPLLIALAIFQLVEIVVASVKAKDGAIFRYPLTIRFVS